MLEFKASDQMLLEGSSPGPQGGRKDHPFQAFACLAQLLPIGYHPLLWFSLAPPAEGDGVD